MAAEWAASHPDVVSRIGGILATSSSEIGPCTKWSRVVDILLEGNEGKVAYYLKDVHTDMIMTHPMNRGKLGLNGFNVHLNGKKIKNMGANLNMLKNAVAFEKNPLKQLEQTQFNIKLSARSGGLIPPLTGLEKILSIGCGHTKEFCRAINAGCKTSEKALQDQNGKLNKFQLCQNDENLRSMCDNGWDWLVIPWEVEATFPMLPLIGQAALNASNNVASKPTEFETMSCMAAMCKQSQENGESPDWEAVVAAAAGTEPSCLNYIDKVGKFVQLYSGSGELVEMLDHPTQLY